MPVRAALVSYLGFRPLHDLRPVFSTIGTLDSYGPTYTPSFTPKSLPSHLTSPISQRKQSARPHALSPPPTFHPPSHSLPPPSSPSSHPSLHPPHQTTQSNIEPRSHLHHTRTADPILHLPTLIFNSNRLQPRQSTLSTPYPSVPQPKYHQARQTQIQSQDRALYPRQPPLSGLFTLFAISPSSTLSSLASPLFSQAHTSTPPALRPPASSNSQSPIGTNNAPIPNHTCPSLHPLVPPSYTTTTRTSKRNTSTTSRGNGYSQQANTHNTTTRYEVSTPSHTTQPHHTHVGHPHQQA